MNRTIILIILYGISGYSMAAQVSVTTKGGLVLEGRITGNASRALQMVTRGHQQTPVGIPLESIAAIRLTGGLDPLPDDTLRQLIGLIPYMDPDSLHRMLDAVRRYAADGDWSAALFYLEALIPLLQSGTIRVEAELIKCEALWRLRLFRELASALEELNTTVAPIHAPLVLCRLNARLQHHLGNHREARFWAELPALQTPVATGPEATELAAFAGEIRESSADETP